MNDLDQFLRDNRPEIPAEGQFLIETNARLAAVEGIKKTVDTERRRGRAALLVALAAGVVLGCLVTAVILLCPASAVPESGILSCVHAFLREHLLYLLAPTACAALALGLLSLRKRSAF